MGIEKTTTTDIDGYYVISELPAGTWGGMVTPSKADYRFNPKSNYVSLLNANTVVNFTGMKIPGYYSVSGTIKNEAGLPVSGIEVTIGCYGDGYIELVKRTTSDDNGYYIISDLPAGCVNYILTPSGNDCYFDPQYIYFKNLDSDMTLDLTCRAKQFYSISGTIKEANGTPISGAIVTFSYSANIYRAFTDINGYYIIPDLPEWENRSEFLDVSHKDYYFDPNYVIIKSLTSSLTQDFIGIKKMTYIQLSGTIKNDDGVPMNDITIILTSSNVGLGLFQDTTTTDINGFYNFQNVVPGNCTIEPVKYGFMFNPTGIYIRELNRDTTNLDFTGHKRSLYTVSGTIKDISNKPINDILVIFYDVFGETYDTTTTDSNGFYIFPGLFEVESYCEIIPSHTKYYFDPQNVTLTSLNSNQIRNFTAKVVMSVDKPNELPNGYSLEQNYPNPFNPSTEIKYTIKESGFATIHLYDVSHAFRSAKSIKTTT